MGNNGNSDRLYFGGLQNHCSHEIKRHILLGRKVMTNLDRILKSRDTTLLTKVHLIKALFFPVVMSGCESWTMKKVEQRKNWCFWTVVLEKTLESLLDSKEIKPVHLEGNQSWIFSGRTGAEASILWPPDAKSWLIGKDLAAGKGWRLEEKGTTEDEMVGWHHWLNGHEFEQAPGVGDGQGSLPRCSSPWGCAESDTTEQLNWTEVTTYLNRFKINILAIFPILKKVNLWGNRSMH